MGTLGTDANYYEDDEEITVDLPPRNQQPKKQYLQQPIPQKSGYHTILWVCIGLVSIMLIIMTYNAIHGNISLGNLVDSFRDKQFSISTPVNVEGDTSHINISTYSDPSIDIDNFIQMNMSKEEIEEAVENALEEHLENKLNQSDMIDEISERVVDEVLENINCSGG